MFYFNKTGKWLESLPEDDRNKILTECKQEGRQMRIKFKERCSAIRRQKLDSMNQKKEQLKRKEASEIVQKEKMTNDIVFHGLWQSAEHVINGLAGLNKVDQLAAIEAQLKYRQKVLLQKADDKVHFQFSSKGQKFPVEQCKDNLISLIEQSFRGPCSEQEGDIPLLVGKRVKHNFSEGLWNGKVLGVVPGFPKYFNIIYDGEQGPHGAVPYTYALGDDYRKGDLEILIAVRVIG